MEIKKDIDVVGLGVSTIDFLNIVDHFPDKEEVQKASQSKLEGGGPVATALVTLARLGAVTAMLDSIGNDWVGKLIIDEYKKENVLVDYLKINSGFTSSIASILVRASDGARTIVYSPGNSPELTASDINAELIQRAKFLHLNGRHYSACISACQLAKRTNTKISFDGGSHRYREELHNIIPLADICIVSKEFSEKYTTERDTRKAAKMFLQEGPEIVIITEGVNGSWLFTKEISEYHQRAYLNPEAVDTTGCGDSFHGAFLFGLCNNYNLFDSIRMAGIVASLNTRQLGGRSSLPTLKDVSDFISTNKY